MVGAKAVFGVFVSASHAEAGVVRLIEAGFSTSEVSVVLKDYRTARDFARRKDPQIRETVPVSAILPGMRTLVVPGLGPVIAAGPIMDGLSRTLTDGLIGALGGLGIPAYEARRYEERVKDGGVLLSAHCDTSPEISRAMEVFKRAGGHELASTGESANVFCHA